MPKKRGHHDGSVYQRKDGRWAASARIAGKRITRYAKTKTEARAKLEHLKVRSSQGQLSLPTDLALDKWLDRWFSLIEPELLPSTLKPYQDVLKPIREVLGDTRIHQLTPMMLTECFSQLQEGTGKRRLHMAHGYLKTCLKQAVNLDLLATNPMDKVRRPKWEPRDTVYWSIEEVRRFIDAGLEGKGHWDPLMVFLCLTGLTISKAIGLRWSDVDLSIPSVNISK